MIHPIAYASHSLDKHERNYGIFKLEILDFMWTVWYFAHLSGKLTDWALITQEMDLTIQHKAGRENSNVDALSCNPIDVSSVCAVSADSDQSLLLLSRKSKRKIVSWLLCFTIYKMVLCLKMKSWSTNGHRE